MKGSDRWSRGFVFDVENRDVLHRAESSTEAKFKPGYRATVMFMTKNNHETDNIKSQSLVPITLYIANTIAASFVLNILVFWVNVIIEL